MLHIDRAAIELLRHSDRRNLCLLMPAHDQILQWTSTAPIGQIRHVKDHALPVVRDLTRYDIGPVRQKNVIRLKITDVFQRKSFLVCINNNLVYSEAKIDYSVAACERGKGYGSQMLWMIQGQLAADQILYIKSISA